MFKMSNQFHSKRLKKQMIESINQSLLRSWNSTIFFGTGLFLVSILNKPYNYLLPAVLIYTSYTLKNVEMLTYQCLHTILHKAAVFLFYELDCSIYPTLILKGKSDCSDCIILHKMAHTFFHIEIVQNAYTMYWHSMGPTSGKIHVSKRRGRRRAVSLVKEVSLIPRLI